MAKPLPVRHVLREHKRQLRARLLTGAHVVGDARLVIGTGLLGLFTTFSTWMVEAQRLGEDHDWTRMWLYLLGSVLLGLATTALGWFTGEALR